MTFENSLCILFCYYFICFVYMIVFLKQMVVFFGVLIFVFWWNVFANTPPGPGTSPVPKNTNYSIQNTEYLPWVPKIPTEKTKDLTQEDPNGWVNGLLATVKNTINRVLGLLALIALIILIYQGVMMLVYARDSKKIEEWYTTVKNVAIALVFIWVSWLIVSFIFRAIWVFTKTT